MTLDSEKEYSGKEIIRAGECFLSDDIYNDSERLEWAMNALSYWRFQHENSLETGLSLLKNISEKHDKSAIFAKRLKRQPSIVFKLRRFPKMKLKNMQDIGGCRAIVSNKKKLYRIVRELKTQPEFKNSNGVIRFKDYIDKPKADGYRGYHLIGSFNDGKNKTKSIELQLRTKIQHDWATALEIVDLFTGQALKSDEGEESWKLFFKLVSEHFTLMEEIHLFSSKNAHEQVSQYEMKLANNAHLVDTGNEVRKLEAALSIVTKLQAFAQSLLIADKHISEQEIQGYVLLRVNTKQANVELTLFKEDQNSEAEKVYLSAEKEVSNDRDIVIALVSTTAVGGIKEAYPNYFADSSDFVKYLLLILGAQQYRKPNFFERLVKRTGL